MENGGGGAGGDLISIRSPKTGNKNRKTAIQSRPSGALDTVSSLFSFGVFLFVFLVWCISHKFINLLNKLNDYLYLRLSEVYVMGEFGDNSSGVSLFSVHESAIGRVSDLLSDLDDAYVREYRSAVDTFSMITRSNTRDLVELDKSDVDIGTKLKLRTNILKLQSSAFRDLTLARGKFRDESLNLLNILGRLAIEAKKAGVGGGRRADAVGNEVLGSVLSQSAFVKK